MVGELLLVIARIGTIFGIGFHAQLDEKVDEQEEQNYWTECIEDTLLEEPHHKQ